MKIAAIWFNEIERKFFTVIRWILKLELFYELKKK